MSRFLAGALVCLAICTANAALIVDEAATSIILRDQKTTALLAIKNTGAESVTAQIALEWVYPSGVAIARSVREKQFPPGRTVLNIPLESEDGADTVWLRLRYCIEAENVDTAGTISVAEKAAHFFELRMAAPFVVQAGETMNIPVYASHPITHRPVAGVHVTGHDEQNLKCEGVTGPDGVATLRFRVPDDVEDNELEISVEGSLGDFSQDVQASFTVSSQPRIVLTTDKPLYQPGQTMHLRALVFSPSGRAMSGAAVSLRVRDPEGIKVFTAVVNTSSFGVAAADWPIPDNLRLGDYTVALHSESFPAHAQMTVKISRYDLPEFTVSVKPDRAYYLPPQDAVIEVKAAYLFGKPVPRGHVRIVREESRQWDYRRQKWDIEEAETYEADAESSGRVAVPVKLRQARKVLDSWQRFLDLGFTAYYRDPSTGRTEQRRFDVRISHDAIHIYQANGYVFTSYADGSPAGCTVTVNEGNEVRTNRYGVARLPVGLEDGELSLRADDGRGGTGSQIDDYYHGGQSDVRIRTDRTIYRPGEPIHVEIETSEDLPSLPFTIRKEDSLLETRWIALQAGHAVLDIPWRKEFAHEVSLAVSWGAEFAARTILFPAEDDLRVEEKPAAAVYRPGEDAAAAIRVALDGRPVESVLGIAVVDRAVAERARTDAIDENPLGSWRRYIGLDRLSGVTREDLYKLDVSRPIPEDLDLLAEAMLAESGWGTRVAASADYQDGLMATFRRNFNDQFRPLGKILDERYKKDYDYPRDLDSLRAALAEGGVDLESVRDPWGTLYRVTHSIRGPVEELNFLSAGPDKQFGTRDDLDAWDVRRFHFQKTHLAIMQALFAARDFPITVEAVRAALAAAGIDADHLLDPWGTMYRLHFRIRADQSIVSFDCAGPDRIFGTKDDFTVDQIEGGYFVRMERVLAEQLAVAKVFPRNAREWASFLHKAKLDPRDPWGNPLEPVFAARSTYTDVRKLYTAAQYGGPAASKTEVVPVTLHFLSLTLRSTGQNGFDLATFTRNYKVEAPSQGETKRARKASVNGGTIAGQVTDAMGAVVACFGVTANRGGSIYKTHCATDGSFRLAGLDPGPYEVRVESPGFQLYLTSNVPVVARRKTTLDVVLRVGSVSETVTVEAAPAMLMTESAQVSRSAVPRETPRLREYFPETLLWQPSLETDADGRAQLKFKLADNITTWDVQVIGSTRDGQVGAASAEIRAFQPFFVDHDPPRILTQGDRIDMPVTVRNYLDQTQNVTVSLHPESWFELAGAARRDARIVSGESANAVFPLRITAAVANGKQRMTASGAEAADAIEKPVTVHPDGREIAVTANTVLRQEGELSFDLPANAIPNSQRVELKLYPNLLSHLVESIGGILERPHGCAEQTISSTYPNLLLLRYLQHTGRANHPLLEQARRNLRAGVDRLLGYVTESGALSYWGGGAADPSLTAYGLTFLNEAAAFTTVDERIVEQMRDALWTLQANDGSWQVHDWRSQIDPGRSLMTTAYVTQALASSTGSEGVRRAMAFLAVRAAESDEPYMIAAHALAANNTSDDASFTASLDRLRGLAHEEAALRYWNLNSNTPFYGWGQAGRLETTALAVRALAAGRRSKDAELIAQSMLFLLRHKDRHGVWLSTQATVQVLNALLEAGAAESPNAAGAAEVMVNGRPVQTIELPDSASVTGPVRADLSAFLIPGANRITVRRGGGTSAQMQIAGVYYVPWQKVEMDPELKLAVQFDRTSAPSGAPITCRVHVERVGFRGHGMLLAEIGLPPGADVDRHSLDRAEIGHYDVLPDRIVIYPWPRAGGQDFSFQFRPRFAMSAKAAPSLLYDYYNPDARVVTAPAQFVIGKVGQTFPPAQATSLVNRN